MAWDWLGGWRKADVGDRAGHYSTSVLIVGSTNIPIRSSATSAIPSDGCWRDNPASPGRPRVSERSQDRGVHGLNRRRIAEVQLAGAIVLSSADCAPASFIFGSRRSRSRCFIISSYFAVPGRGGASAGRPPAHFGIRSPIPADRCELMLPHPAKLHATSEAQNTRESRRMRKIMESDYCPGVEIARQMCAATFSLNGSCPEPLQAKIYTSARPMPV